MRAALEHLDQTGPLAEIYDDPAHGGPLRLLLRGLHALQVFLKLVGGPSGARHVGLELDDEVPDDNVAPAKADNLSHEVDWRDDLGSVRHPLAVEGGDHGAVVDPLAVAFAERAHDPQCVAAQELDGAFLPLAPCC